MNRFGIPLKETTRGLQGSSPLSANFHRPTRVPAQGVDCTERRARTPRKKRPSVELLCEGIPCFAGEHKAISINADWGIRAVLRCRFSWKRNTQARGLADQAIMQASFPSECPKYFTKRFARVSAPTSCFWDRQVLSCQYTNAQQ